MKKAIVYFLKPEEGGRKTPPNSTTYATTKIENFSPAFWSIVIQFEKPLGIQEYTSPCEFTFLVDNAPFHILSKISELCVYEGPKEVGK